MSILALIWGLFAFLGFCIGLLPCLGWFNWLNIPFSLAGVILGVIGVSGSRGRPPGPAMAGLLLSAFSAGLGMIRLALGFGIF